MAEHQFQSHVDTRALEVATKALARIESHEKVCEQRWIAIHSTLTETKVVVDLLHGRFFNTAVALIGILLAALGFMVAKYMM